MIDVRNIHFSYGPKPVLYDISLSLGSGKLCGILGANGSGKTTLLKCLLGILPADTGHILINGQSMAHLQPGKRARRVAYVPQSTKQFSTSTVFENVLLGRKPYFHTKPSQKDIEIASDILAELNLEELAMQPVNQLSGGQRQRVCIAKALCQQTPVIILDEPTANLDVRYKIEVMRLLEKLADQGKTILISVHEIAVAQSFCTDVVLLKDGRILAQGGKEVLHPQNIERLYDVNYEDISFLFSSPNDGFVNNGFMMNDSERVAQWQPFSNAT